MPQKRKRKPAHRNQPHGKQSWNSHIQKVLKAQSEPMHYADIAEEIGRHGLRKLGANAPSSVSATISLSLSDDKNSPYIKVGRGMYTLKEHLLSAIPTAEAAEDPAAGLINAFGLHWDREKIDWTKATPRMLGASSPDAEPVNFHDQHGVYILYDRAFRLVYIGQSVDALGKRLKGHTGDRLKGRWHHFSWFGFRKVNDDTGKLEEVPAADGGVGKLSDMLEAVLIEAMEPPANRKRGTGIEGCEFLQVTSSDHKKEEAKKMLNEMIKGM